MIDEEATKEEIDCTMTYNRTLSFIKQKFNHKFEFFYNKFTSIARDDAIEAVLQKEIDFEYYIKSGVILDYQYMHKGTII
jgi:hypothetical protein